MRQDRLRGGESGVAMMMAMIAMFLLAIIAGEIVYQSGVFSSVVFRQRDELRAQLLARSGLRLALLQLRAAKKGKEKAKSMGLGENSSVVEQIWRTPLMFPPPDIPGLPPSDSAALAEFRKSLGLEGSVTINIQGESGKYGINQLVWPSYGNSSDIMGVSSGGDRFDPSVLTGGGSPSPNPTQQYGTNQSAEEQRKEAQRKVKESFVQIFQNILEQKRQDDDTFREKYPSLNGEQIVGNILAWMDPFTSQDGDQRDKNDYYGRAEPSPYAIKNAPIVSTSEYHMIKGLDETISKIVIDNFSTQPTNSLDVNRASMLLIRALIPDLKPDVMEAIEKRRKDESLGGPFKDAQDFWNFVNRYGNYEDSKKEFEKKGLKILESDTTFHVVISAESGLSRKTWLANIGPLPPKVDPDPAGSAPQPPRTQPVVNTPNSATGSTNTSTSTDSGDFDSLSVIYLRAE